MPISIAPLWHTPQGETIESELEFHSLADVELTQPVRGVVTFDRVSLSEILASIELDTAVTLECDRCLTTFALPMKLSFQQVFSERPDEEMLPIRGRAIDLTDPVREQILLAIPLKRLCKINCSGIQINKGDINGST